MCFGFLHRFPVCTLGWFWYSVIQTNNQIPQVECKLSIHSQTSIQRYDLGFCGAVRHWRLLLAHPTDRNKCSTSKMNKTPPDVDFESSRSPAKSESWNSPDRQCEPHFPHDNIGGNHLWNECWKLIVPIVCHMLEFMFWKFVPTCWLTTECQVDHFVPSRSTLIQIWEQTSDNSPLFSYCSFVDLVIVQSKQGCPSTS